MGHIKISQTRIHFIKMLKSTLELVLQDIIPMLLENPT